MKTKEERVATLKADLAALGGEPSVQRKAGEKITAFWARRDAAKKAYFDASNKLTEGLDIYDLIRSEPDMNERRIKFNTVDAILKHPRSQ